MVVDVNDDINSYEPYKSNILSTPEEVVLRSLPNGVKDTLNLMTGEYVQRIGETTLDGSSRNDLHYHAVLKEQDGQFCRMIINGCSFYNKSKYGNCDKLTFYHTEKTNVPVEGVFPYSGNDHFYIQISTSRISGADSMEGASGEFGVYIDSKGDKSPWRLKMRPMGLSLTGALDKMLQGQKIADLVTTCAAVDFVIPDIDR